MLSKNKHDSFRLMQNEEGEVILIAKYKVEAEVPINTWVEAHLRFNPEDLRDFLLSNCKQILRGTLDIFYDS